ncbi:TonB-dependent receptor [Bradyrhizobium sp. AUGA SZCCT0240]|uniref:TonB-dependent receptor n=1 Tax=unclassified Bradyrhizobium TaxID=2631580 RepID=UPI001BACCA9B|nr:MULTISPECIES: TonB-dependent receptor [unclassified Bradyrhizobium]MBR1196105.1 TonB-dependent receptor [Bradyrhizobium sp. AUGA SZCCT0158]MBR1240361.1 TonB-dependent receptor [Bradyrhizobium sp. AUGA SZCCT0274]MBR1248990.1 TonB-dependent receptor [Bradyrhizobium sp. AUGA SZCCT0169]MBR1256034.1 TonB-dependent receptor [Bradyrhizobium sp. AUGA SZCCT0240]
MLPAEAQERASQPGQLPPVTITASDPTPKRAARSSQSQNRGARNRTAINSNQPVTAGASGVAPGTSSDGAAALQPTAASAVRISGAEVNAVPFLRPGEALEVVPGLIVTQHSGEGKANQYFLRGFNLDHGTDLSIKVDGMPVNMPTHGHGQGYSDINFLIPELIQSLNVRKGPYFADVGDFSSAGSVEIDYLTKLPKNLAELTVGSFGYRRGVAAGSVAVGAGTLLSAIEGVKYNGPWDVPDDVRKINGVMRYSQGTATDGMTLTAMAYSNAWNSTDQVAQRAVDQGVIGRFGTLDPTDGGVASRFSLSGNFAHSSEYGQSKINAYVVRSNLQLYNNFTYFLDDPVNGDQFNQRDSRTLGGFDARHAFDWRLDGLETQTRIGLQSRYDDIHVGLFKTQQRGWLSTVREDRVREGNVGVWMDSTTRWTDWLRTTVGIREDVFAGSVLSDTPENSGNAQASMASPKAGIVLGPWYKTEFFGNAGYGLHSNDIRGATITVDPIDKVTPQNRVPLLVRSKGAELGVRTRAIDGLTSSVAVFMLDFDSELLFVGDAGTTEASRPSRRVGVEWTNKYKPVPWLTFDLDVAYTRARFTDFDAAGDRIPGAPAWIASGAITFGHETGWFGALKGRYFGPRPLIEDDSVRSLSSLIFNARAGYRFDSGIRLQLDVLNLFNAKTNQIEYYYLSRLPGEPVDGVADRHVHPAEPLAVRVTLAGRF